ncbi:Siderophore synthetase component [Streptomyces sp. DvalAA-14]|uniref:IucA/IucC family protein n=1 Tax=unclassified Streptomyces TaxID=2593676 RepID=UPI00081B29E0|nr:MULTISPECIES: IucA/IucC family siderophore biosynthesis protein [unclassified Streptomyces]MYS22956.1 IucA/IucC family siderophore biosynthesis protein [Streptomyces sp. SID4948]SCE25089.1 Siderophore synthetase component [Streptomyces sp. DvalAA-14]
MTPTAPSYGPPVAVPGDPDGAESSDGLDSPDDATAHLTPALWARATRHLVRKALAEFAHERLLQPIPDARPDPRPDPNPGADPIADPRAESTYSLASDDGATTYRFTAARLALDHWHIDPESITRHHASAHRTAAGHRTAGRDRRGTTTGSPLDALAFFTEFRAALGLSDRVLPLYLEEITATLAALAFKYAAQDRRPRSAEELAGAGFQAIESGMTEGHPCFVANAGRLGFGAHDLLRYAPEAGAPVRLTWLAARRDLATFTAGRGLDYDTLIAAELDEGTRRRFSGQLTAHGLDPADYLLLPVHPWQWEHKLAVSFAAEIAQRHLVHLGSGDDDYLAQQSIRTFFNASRPGRHYVKTALSVLNMGFTRGLSAAYMEATPAINDWLAALIAADPAFTAARFTIIRERAAIGYHHPAFEAATTPGSPYRKMLAALWRESPVADLEPGRSLATMASLLHLDADGGSFAAALITRSGRSAEQWLRGYLDAYLVPVLHSLFAYDLAYMPHGENVILVLGEDGGTVERVVFKDIAEEIVVMDARTPLPPRVERIRAAVPEGEQVLAVFTDVFDSFLRFLSAILHTGNVLHETVFWQTVGACVTDYQQAHPELAAAFRRHDLFAPEFALSCLNRLQLRDNQQMVDLADPSAALQFAGTLPNPLAAAGPDPRPVPPPADPTPATPPPAADPAPVTAPASPPAATGSS